MIHKIENKNLVVKISSLGAELISVIDKKSNTEFIWQGDEKYWTGHSPILFPQCGRIYKETYLCEGKPYQMGVHGFARNQQFNVENKLESEIELSITDNEETKLVYPFKFKFIVNYKLLENVLNITFKITNCDNKTMYFSYGGHPGFNVPFGGVGKFEDYYVEFSKTIYPIKKFNKNGLYERNDDIYKLVDKKIPLSHSLFLYKESFFFEDDNDIIYLKNIINNNYIKLTFNNMKTLGLWQTPESDAKFLCIEPWNGVPGLEGEITKLEDKIGILKLKPQTEHLNSYQIEFFIE